MTTLALTTRFKDDGLEGSACLLVYDLTRLSGVSIGDDVRDILDRHPNTLRFYVLAPFLTRDSVDLALLEGIGSALTRAGANKNSPTVAIASLEIRRNESAILIQSAQFFLHAGKPMKGTTVELSKELINGWLFHLFDSSKGLVDAPVGVHFAKASSKHSTKFLRTSSALLSSEACGALAYFSLGEVSGIEPRRIFVDTAPLLSVAFAMQRIAMTNSIWEQMPPAKSFSSYGGVGGVKIFSKSDLVLISASTSGGLAKRLIDSHVNKDMLLTLYLLKSSMDMKTDGRVLCDLTVRPGRMFGYSLIDNHATDDCTLCKKGYVLAELEGDQFMLEKRAIKRLRVGAGSQIGTAKKDLEEIARNNAIYIHLYELQDSKTNIEVNLPLFLRKDGKLLSQFLYQLQRFSPPTLDVIVAVGMTVNEAKNYCLQAGFRSYVLNNVRIVTDAQLDQLAFTQAANALILIAYLSDHSLIRGLNVQLRNKINGGCATYISALTIADSSRNLEDLRIFLSYGEHGPETFTFRSTIALMLPWLKNESTSWAHERNLWVRLSNELLIPEEFAARLTWLQNTASSTSHLFLTGSCGELKIAPDFVLLDTKNQIEKITQADVYAVVNNALAAERSDCVPLNSKPKPDRKNPTPIWGQLVYHQTVICPSNFRDFNDAVLRAALLRAANIQELNYKVDETSSEEMLDVIQADIQAWDLGRGDALPEFLLSLASERMQLMSKHIERIQSNINTSTLPSHLKFLASIIPK
jgi:hypothetical protein